MTIKYRAQIVAALTVFFAIAPSLAFADTELFTSNPGFETDSTGWTQGNFGTVTANYSVVADAHGGTKAGNVTVSAIGASSEAKWLSPAITVTPGEFIK